MFQKIAIFSLVLLWSCFMSASTGEAAIKLAQGNLPGDFNEDGLRNGEDINALVAVGDLTIGIDVADLSAEYQEFDLNGDGRVSTQDIASWLALGAIVWDPQVGPVQHPPTVMGDTNLDGDVEKEDENVVLRSIQQFENLNEGLDHRGGGL